MTEPNNGAFYIPAEDKNDDNSFVVPGDQTGESPEGTDNPDQLSYSVDNRQKQHGKGYYVHVKNGWDVDMKLVLYGSSFDDREMRKPVIEQNNSELEPGEQLAFESDTGHSFLELEINNLINPPTSGTLEVVFQDRYR